MLSNELNLHFDKNYFERREARDLLLYKVGSNKQIYKKYGTSYVVKKVKKSNHSICTQNQTQISKHIKQKQPKHIVQIYQTWQRQDQYYFIMKYYPYTLRAYLTQKSEYLDAHPQLRFQIVLQIIYGLIQLGCTHRDLKLENILVQELADNQIKVVLIDFNTCNNGQALNLSIVGTYSYMAPQIMFLMDQVSPYTRNVDIWSLGIIMYKIFMGVQEQPYNFQFSRKETRNDQLIKFNSCIQNFQISLNQQLDETAKYLIRQMLEDKPKKRISLILILTKLKEAELTEIYSIQNPNTLTKNQKQLKYYYQKQVEIDKMEQSTLNSIEKIKDYHNFYQSLQITNLCENEKFKYDKLVAFFYSILYNMIEPYKKLKKISKIKQKVLKNYIFDGQKNLQLVKEQEIKLKRLLIRKFLNEETLKQLLLNYDFLNNQLIKDILLQHYKDKVKAQQILHKYQNLRQ